MTRTFLMGIAILFGASTLLADFETPGPGPAMPTQPEARPWDLKIRTFFGYNDNVNGVPDITFFDGETDSPYFGVQVEGGYRFVQNREWTAGIVMAIDRVWYTNDQNAPDPNVNDDASEYNLLVVQPAIYVDHRLALFSRPASIGMSYNFRFEELDVISAGGVRGHTLAWNVGINPCEAHPNFWLGAKYSLGFNDFQIDDESAFVQRSGMTHAFDLTAQYTWDHGRRKVAATYSLFANDADSGNFQYIANGVKLRLESHLVASLWGSVDCGFRYADYDGFTGGGIPPPGRERQEIFDFGLTFIYVIDAHWSLDLFYRHVEIQSNQAQFEASYNNVGFGITFRF